ncbi:hypothetical protein BDW68DRAFT_88205 [Aspergillus falconensis]
MDTRLLSFELPKPFLLSFNCQSFGSSSQASQRGRDVSSANGLIIDKSTERIPPCCPSLVLPFKHSVSGYARRRSRIAASFSALAQCGNATMHVHKDAECRSLVNCQSRFDNSVLFNVHMFSKPTVLRFENAIAIPFRYVEFLLIHILSQMSCAAGEPFGKVSLMERALISVASVPGGLVLFRGLSHGQAQDFKPMLESMQIFSDKGLTGGVVCQKAVVAGIFEAASPFPVDRSSGVPGTCQFDSNPI